MSGPNAPAGPSQGGASRSVAVAGAAEGLEGDDLDEASGPQPRGVKVKVADADPMIGTVIAGRYRIDARLGEGGMGAVYRVEHTHMRKRLALKVLHREMTNQTEIVQRFEREAMAAAHIDHPNVAGATDFGKLEDGTCYLVLEYVEGTSLRSLIDKGALSMQRAIHITVQMFAALRRAHELGIIHRDLKPENVLLVDKDGDADFVKVLDFGIARVPIGSLGGGKGDSGPSLTRAGMVYGTPEYMAPEQALGQAVDGRSDLYGVGVMLFEMLTGRRPYDNKDKVALLGQHVAGPIPSVRDRAPQLMIPTDLDAAVAKLLQKSPSDRFADASAATEALLAIGTEPANINFKADRSGDWPASGRPSPGQIPVASDGSPKPGSAAEGAPMSGIGLPPSVSGPTIGPPSAAAVAIFEPSRKNPVAFIALGAVVIVLLIGGVFLATRKGADEAETRKINSSQATTSSGSGGTAPVGNVVQSELKLKADDALKKVSAGNWEAGMSELKVLSETYPSEPVVLKAYAVGLSKTKKHVEALATVKKLVTVSPGSASDPELDKVFDDALSSPTAVETVFNLLEGPMGGEGGRLLYDIAYGNKGAAQSGRARKSLADPEVQKNLTPPIRAALDLRAAPYNCAAKKAAIEKNRNDLDARAIPILRPFSSTRGCGGFFKKDDCWPCLHEKGFLDAVIKEIEERGKSARGFVPPAADPK